jgi:hypothetical protein
MSEAVIKRLTDPLSLDVLVARYPRRRGVATIKAILANARLGLDVTRGELEERFQWFLDAYGLPKPELNVELEFGGRRCIVDCVWRDRRLIVELDGHAAHATRVGFESDRARDRAITVAGWRVIRITWRQLHEYADALAADLRALLGNPAAPTPG